MHRFTSHKGIEIIKSFESFSAVPYVCPAGYPTIGYGHVILPGQHYETLSLEDAENLLRKDLLLVERAVIRNINVPLGEDQFDALVSLTFNIGSGALQRSTLRQKINYNSGMNEIKQEFMKWIYAQGRVLSGLVRRRIVESELYVC